MLSLVHGPVDVISTTGEHIIDTMPSDGCTLLYIPGLGLVFSGSEDDGFGGFRLYALDSDGRAVALADRITFSAAGWHYTGVPLLGNMTMGLGRVVLPSTSWYGGALDYTGLLSLPQTIVLAARSISVLGGDVYTGADPGHVTTLERARPTGFAAVYGSLAPAVLAQNLWWIGDGAAGTLYQYDATAKAYVVGSKTGFGLPYKALAYSPTLNVFFVLRLDASRTPNVLQLYVYANEPVAASIAAPSFSASPKIGEVLTLSTQVLGDLGEPCPNRAVTFTADAGAIDVHTVWTDFRGYARTKWRALWSALSGRTVTATLTDTTPPITPATLALAVATVAADTAVGTLTFTVNRTGNSGGVVGLSWATADGTATAGTDYTAGSGSLSWANGDTAAKTFTVAVTNHTLSGSKTFTVNLSAPTGTAVLGLASETITLSTAAGTSTLALSAASYSADTTIGSLVVSVNRTGTSTGIVGLSYATANGTALAGTDYTSTSGTLSWASGDSAAKTISIPITNHVLGSAKTFSLALSAPTGTAVLGTSTSTVTLSTATAALSIKVSGGKLVDGRGRPVQLRGVNFPMDSVAIQGWDPSDPTGGNLGVPRGPNWDAIVAWKINCIRITVNAASWLGYSCTDTDGVVHNPDPGGNYQSTIIAIVAAATARGIYSIIDLHWCAPFSSAPMLQTQMAEADHSLTYWTSVSNQFKTNPSVIFELYNEPYFQETGADFTGDAWQYMMFGTGGSFAGYPATSSAGHQQDIRRSWAIASYQQMITTVRATGATNVVLVGCMQYAQDFSGWLSHVPTDPAGQMAASWHPYSTYGTTWGTPAYAQPNYGPAVFDQARAIMAAGYPVVATETGDKNTPGTVGAPLVKTVTEFADATGSSVIGWRWNTRPDADYNELVLDNNGTPSPGYGVFFKNWLVNHA